MSSNRPKLDPWFQSYTAGVIFTCSFRSLSPTVLPTASCQAPKSLGQRVFKGWPVGPAGRQWSECRSDRQDGRAGAAQRRARLQPHVTATFITYAVRWRGHVGCETRGADSTGQLPAPVHDSSRCSATALLRAWPHGRGAGHGWHDSARPNTFCRLRDSS